MTTDRRHRRRVIDVLRLDNGEEVFLAHSHPDHGPDEEGGGYAIPCRSVIWARAGTTGAWRRTEYRGKGEAMDGILGAITAEEAITLLVEFRMAKAR